MPQGRKFQERHGDRKTCFSVTASVPANPGFLPRNKKTGVRREFVNSNTSETGLLLFRSPVTGKAIGLCGKGDFFVGQTRSS